MLRNRIFSVENDNRGDRIVIDLEKVYAIIIRDFKKVEITFEHNSIYLELGIDTSDRLFQQFIEYKTVCPCTPPLKKPLPTSGTEIKAM